MSIFRDRLDAKWLAVCAIAAIAWPASCATSSRNPDVLRDTLPNGLRVVIARDPVAPVVSTVMTYGAGSADCPQGLEGLAYAQEQMMFRGSPGLSAGQLAAIITSLGGQFDADTQPTVTRYSSTVAAPDLDVVLRLEALRMRGVVDAGTEWSPLRSALERELERGLAGPGFVRDRRLLASVFQGTTYAGDGLGTRASLERITAPVLRKFYRDWYTPGNALLVVAGDVQPQKVDLSIRALFGDIPPRNTPEHWKLALPSTAPEVFTKDTRLPQGSVALSFPMPGSDSADYAAARVLANILNGPYSGLRSLLGGAEAKSVFFSLTGWPKATLGTATATFSVGGDGSALQKQMGKILTGYANNGFPLAAVEAARRNEITLTENARDSIPGLAWQWSQAVAVEGRSSPDDDVAALRRVTVADVNRVAHRYLDWNRGAAGILNPLPHVKRQPPVPPPSREVLLAAPVEPAALPAWASSALTRLDVPAGSRSPSMTVLSNGIRLIVQPRTSSDLVSVYGHVEINPGLEAPKGKEGVDELLDRMLSLDRPRPRKAFYRLGAVESMGTDFALHVMEPQFDRGMRLLARSRLNPKFSARSFDTVRSQLEADVAARLNDPGHRAVFRVHQALLPQGSPALRRATPNTVAGTSLADVRAFYKRVFRPDMTTIVVIGNVSPKRAGEVVSRYFGSWRASEPKPKTSPPPVPLNPFSMAAVPAGGRNVDLVTLAELVGISRTSPDYYALLLGNQVLGRTLLRHPFVSGPSPDPDRGARKFIDRRGSLPRRLHGALPMRAAQRSCRPGAGFQGPESDAGVPGPTRDPPARQGDPAAQDAAQYVGPRQPGASMDRLGARRASAR